MDIEHIEFESPLRITIADETVEIIPFETQEPGNIKFGIKAPRSIKVHREEIHEAIKQKSHAQPRE